MPTKSTVPHGNDSGAVDGHLIRREYQNGVIFIETGSSESRAPACILPLPPRLSLYVNGMDNAQSEIS